MPTHTPVSQVKSSVALLILFPFITFVLLVALQPIPVLGRLATAATLFSAPGIWILAAMRDTHTASPFETIAALSLHYPILGVVAGFFFPFEVSLTRACAKQIAVRYGLCVFGIVGVGIALALYAVAHDS